MANPWTGPVTRRRSAMLRQAAALLVLSGLVFNVPRSSLAAGASASSFIDSGTVTYATGGSVADIDPASVVTAAANVVVTANIDEGLVTYKGSDVNQFVPLLATSWSANANSSVWTFHLRHGVKFHTGRCCMTADDVKYSIARTVLANLAGAYIFGRYMTDPMKQIKILDPYTVEFDLGRPQFTFINAIASKNAGLIMDSLAVKKHATKSDPWAHNWATANDAGTGPYVLKSWQHNAQEVLVRFADYWKGWSGKHFGKVIMVEVPSTTTRRAMLERGTADLTFSLTPQDAQALRANPAVRVTSPYGTEIDYIDFAQAGPLASPLARQALSYAFNYTAYLKAAFLGFARRGYGPMASVLKGFDPNVFKYQTDLNKAKALLARAGIKPGTTLTYMYVTGYDSERTAGLILQAQLAQIGITLQPIGVTQSAQGSMYFGNTPPAKRPNLMFYAWWPDYNDAWDNSVVMVDSASAGPNGANIGYYHNKQVDALLADMKVAEPARAAADAKKMQDITARVDPAAIWLDEPAQVTILAHNLQGYVFNPLDVQVYSFYSMYRG